MTPYIVLGDGQEASRTDLAYTVQTLVDLLLDEQVSNDDIKEILDENNITYK